MAKRSRAQRGSDAFSPDASPMSPPPKRSHQIHGQMSPTPMRKDLDWVLSSTSITHVAYDRGLFTNYTPFRSHIETAAGQKAVHGIGTIEYPYKVSELSCHHILLQEVLHVPAAAANIVSAFQLNRAGYQICLSPYDGQSFVQHITNNRPPLNLVRLNDLFYFEGAIPLVSELPSSLMLCYQWPPAERQRWATFEAQLVAKLASGIEIECISQNC